MTETNDQPVRVFWRTSMYLFDLNLPGTIKNQTGDTPVQMISEQWEETMGCYLQVLCYLITLAISYKLSTWLSTLFYTKPVPRNGLTLQEWYLDFVRNLNKPLKQLINVEHEY